MRIRLRKEENKISRKIKRLFKLKRLLREIQHERTFMREASYNLDELRFVRRMIDQYIRIKNKLFN